MAYLARHAIYSGSLPIPKVNAAPRVDIEVPSQSALAAYASRDQSRLTLSEVLQLSEDPRRRFRLKVVNVDNYQRCFALEKRPAISPPKRIQTPTVESAQKYSEEEEDVEARKLRELKKRHGLYAPRTPRKRPETPLWKKYYDALSRGHDKLTFEVSDKIAFQGPFPVDLTLEVALLSPTPSSPSTLKQGAARREKGEDDGVVSGKEDSEEEAIKAGALFSCDAADDKVSCKSFSHFGYQERREAEGWVTLEPRPSSASGRIEADAADKSVEESDFDEHNGSEIAADLRQRKEHVEGAKWEHAVEARPGSGSATTRPIMTTGKPFYLEEHMKRARRMLEQQRRLAIERQKITKLEPRPTTAERQAEVRNSKSQKKMFQFDASDLRPGRRLIKIKPAVPKAKVSAKITKKGWKYRRRATQETQENMMEAAKEMMQVHVQVEKCDIDAQRKFTECLAKRFSQLSNMYEDWNNSAGKERTEKAFHFTAIFEEDAENKNRRLSQRTCRDLKNMSRARNGSTLLRLDQGPVRTGGRSGNAVV